MDAEMKYTAAPCILYSSESDSTRYSPRFLVFLAPTDCGLSKQVSWYVINYIDMDECTKIKVFNKGTSSASIK